MDAIWLNYTANRYRKSTGRPHKADEKAQLLLKKDVDERPSATISQRRRFLEHITGSTLSDSTVRRLMKMLGFPQKRTMGHWNETSSSDVPGE
jgi:transposase